MTHFIRLLDFPADAKADALDAVVAAWRSAGQHPLVCEVPPDEFRQVPGSPFAYWVSPAIRHLFQSLESFDGDTRAVRTGLQTSNDFRFARLWWEVDPSADHSRAWRPMTKGGCTDPFYADIPLMLAWDPGEQALRAFRSVIRNTEYYFQPGLTWTLRAAAFRPQVLPEGAIISLRGSGMFTGGEDTALHYLGLMNSIAADSLIKLMMGRSAHPQFDIGDVAMLPVPSHEKLAGSSLGDLALQGWELRRSLDRVTQTSHAFTLPALLQVNGRLLADRIAAWGDRLAAARDELARLQSAIDTIAYSLYGISEEDRRQMEGGGDAADSLQDEEDASADEDSHVEEAAGADPTTLVESLLEWAVGTSLGHFDIRLANGDFGPRPEPEPFDPLPSCSPGMLQDEAGLPTWQPPADYSLAPPPHGLLVDDPGHPWDVVGRVQAVMELVAGDQEHVWLQELETTLRRDLREWLRRHAFDRHLKRYSRSGRKAPLFWQLAPKSREYSIWLYSPAATRDTFYRILNDYLDPRLKAAERRLLELRQDAGSSPTIQQRKNLTTQESLVQDLRAFREEVARVALLWRPIRDDGVVLNCAVLWRLFDHHRAWQGECKKKWGELAKGQYDWAGWAMHLWPERVVNTCASDRSIAIAHGLEEALWQEGEDGKWKPRPDAREQVARLTAERYSTAIQAALDDFIRAG